MTPKKISDKQSKKLHDSVMKSLDKLAEIDIDLKKEDIYYVITKRA